MSFADWLWSMIASALGLKTIPDLLDTNSTHTGIAYVHLIAPHTCDYMGYVRHVGHAAWCNKNYLWLLGIEYEKWCNCPHPCRTVSPNGLNTIDRRKLHPWAWYSGFTGGIQIIKFIHSFTLFHNYYWGHLEIRYFLFAFIFIIGLILPTCANTSERSASSRVWCLGPFSGF